MDKTSLIGTLIGIAACTYVGYRASEGHWAIFYSEKGMVMVFGGTLSVALMAMPGEKLKRVPGYVRSFMFHKAKSPGIVIKQVVALSEKGRRDGVLALESEINKLDDKFLAQGLKMLVDGTAPEMIETSLRMELLAMQERHKAGKKFFDLIKLYAPGYGLVATLIGQIGMFGNLGGDVKIMGHMLQVAVVATMYGTVLANAVAGPIGDKLSIRSGEEIVNREMMLQGLLSIGVGDNPRVTMEKMLAFLPHAARQKVNAA
jgi:chemotaxis protein MotA